MPPRCRPASMPIIAPRFHTPRCRRRAMPQLLIIAPVTPPALPAGCFTAFARH
jgi:hypothetical protein